MSRFRPIEAFHEGAAYGLLPFRFRRMAGLADRILITNDGGEQLLLDEATFQSFVDKRLAFEDPAYWDLESRHFLHRRSEPVPLEAMALQYRSRKAFVFQGPALHIVVVTLRCNHSCRYCQVSRQVEGEDARKYDLRQDHADCAVEHILRSPSREVTVEFQGGEPLLAFEIIRYVIERLDARRTAAGKSIRYVITSVLHHLTPERLEFMRRYDVQLSTSLDGPAELHNRNRPLPSRDSFDRTLQGIAMAREALGDQALSALTTLTRDSLAHPEAIIDQYRALGLHAIFLRPLSPYGFAAKTRNPGYSTSEFLTFYRRAFLHLLKVNRDGFPMEEVYAALLLRSILTPFAHGYVDLRSPAGAGFGTLVYNYDGRVYPSDEARMLAAMGDDTFWLGTVEQPYEALFASDAMRLIASASIAESLPGCADCAFVPYCGADPVDAYRRQGDVVGHRPTSAFCARHIGMFELLFEYLDRNDREEMQILRSWVSHRLPLQPESDHVAAAAA